LRGFRKFDGVTARRRVWIEWRAVKRGAS
jgi:hypothetical protein